MKYLRDHLMIAKYITFNRSIRSSFETFRSHFCGFANLVFDFINILFAKMHLTFELFLQNMQLTKIPMKYATNGKYCTYVTITER